MKRIKNIFTATNTERQGKIDLTFLVLVMVISVFGTVTVFTAGYAYASVRYGDAMYFVKRQLIWLIVGFIAMIFSSRIPVKKYKELSPFLYAITLALLILTLIIGFVGNGAKRWISIGPITIQPSEIAKLTIVMMLARYFSNNKEKAMSKKGSFLFGTLIPSVIMLIPIILVMLQKHLSCIIILGCIGLILIFLSGINPKYIAAFTGIGALGVTALAIFTDYTKERITVWRDPEAYKLTGGWQTLQGLMAIGSGGLFGVGLGKSIMKHCYVSEPANDMIFAILCEELGLAGAAVCILLFGFLIYRGALIGLRSEDCYCRLLSLGISVKMAVQVLLNIAVVTNTIPNTGISLPFFSYGGSSLVMLLFEMGIMLSISRNSRITK